MLYILFFFFIFCVIIFSLSGWLLQGSNISKRNMIGFPCYSCFLQCLYLLSTIQASCGLLGLLVLLFTFFVNITGLPFTFMQVSLNSRTFWVYWSSVLMGHFKFYMQMEWQGTGDKHIAYISALLSHCTSFLKFKFKDKIIKNCKMVTTEH